MLRPFLRVLLFCATFLSLPALAQTLILTPPPSASCAASPPQLPGDYPINVGRWVDPTRVGPSWDFYFNNYNQLTAYWYGFDSNGRPVWYISDTYSISGNTWRAPLYEARIQNGTAALVGQVGEIAATIIPSQPDKMAVRWRVNGVNLPSGDNATDCLYRRGSNLQLRSANANYSGYWYALSSSGWGGNTLILPTTLNGTTTWLEEHIVAIYDLSASGATYKSPVWLLARKSWLEVEPPTSLQKIPLTYVRWNPSRVPNQRCTENCTTETELPFGNNYYQRSFDSTATGGIGVYAYLDNANIANDQRISFAEGYSTPLLSRKLTNAYGIKASPDVCQAPAGQTTCQVLVQWTPSILSIWGPANALAYRRVIDASGNLGPRQVPPLSGNGQILDELEVGQRVQYELFDTTANISYGRTSEIRITGYAVPGNPVLAADPGQQDDSDQVLALDGAVSVDGAGAASYTLPITLPPGRNGLQPKLSIDYASNAGEGELGRGFSMGGQSAITRCRKTKEHGDGEGPFPAIAFTEANDQYCLDGQRLLLVRNAHGGQDAEYRTEIDSFQKVQISAVESGHPSEFKVYQGNGHVVTYGGSNATAKSMLGTDVVALRWAIAQVQDAYGNAVNYSYEGNVSDGMHRISSINYIGGRVDFSYTALAAGQERVQYVSGAKWTRNANLSSISVANNNGTTVLARYDFALTPVVQNSSLFRLNSIQKCVGTVCSKPVTFTWAPDLSLAEGNTSSTSVSWVNRKTEGFQLGDLDGDGRQEIVYVEDNNNIDRLEILSRATVANGNALSFSAGRASNPEHRWRYDHPIDLNRGWQIRDSNGDGRDDLLRAQFLSQEFSSVRLMWNLHSSNGAGFSNVNEDGSPYELAFPKGVFYVGNGAGRNAIAVPADFTGDGIPDMLTYDGTDAIFDGLAIRDVKRTANTSTLDQYVVAKGIVLQGVSGNCEVSNTIVAPRFRVIDANSDGRADLLIRVSGANCTFAANENFLQPYKIPATGGGRGEVPDPAEVKHWQVLFVHDLAASGTNGGTFKIYAAWQVDGQEAVASKFDENFRLEDLNSDGQVDVLYQNKGGKDWQYQINTGRLSGSGVAAFTLPMCARLNPTGSQCSIINGSDDGIEELEFFDYDGDGSVDLWESVNDKYTVFPWTGTGFSRTGIATDYEGRDGTTVRRLLRDFDGDDIPENFWIRARDGAGTMGVNKFTRANSHHQPHSVITQVDNGLGKQTVITYGLSTFADTYRRDYSAAKFMGRSNSPIIDVSAPTWLVKRISESSPAHNNASAQRSMRYRYVGQKIQAGGRGSLGFRVMETLDEQKLIQTRTEYRQDFPFIGKAVKSQVTLLPQAWPELCGNPDSASCMTRCVSIDTASGQCTDFDALPTNAKILNTVTSLYETVPSQSVPGVVLSGITIPAFVYPTSTETTQYDLNSGCNSATAGQICDERKLKRELSVFKDFDEYGNAKKTATDIYDKNSTLLQKVTVDAVFENRTATVWQLGLVTNSTVTQDRPLDRKIRVSSADYNTQGSVSAEHQEPDLASLALTLHTYHDYDNYGNRTKTSVCSHQLTASACRATVASTPLNSTDTWIQRYSKTTFDSIGLFPVASYAPLDNSTGDGIAVNTVLSRSPWGLPETERDANGVVTKSYFGKLGLPYAKADSQGRLQTTRMRMCSGFYCPSGAIYLAYTVDISGPDQWVYFDALGRTILSVGQSLAANNVARFTAVRTGYDALGREVKSSQPYFDYGPQSPSIGTPIPSASRFETTRSGIDVLDRVTLTINPDGGTVTTSYTGFTTLTTLPANTSALAQTRSEVRNALGEITSITDAAGLTVSYGYNAQGLLSNVSRPNDAGGPAIVTSMFYDELGRKTIMVDPDKGSFNYEFNALGEQLVEKATGTNASCATMRYDRLGRKRTRSDYASASCSGTAAHSATWTYDNAPGGLGHKTAESSVTGTQPAFERQFRFDAYARPREVETTYPDGTRYRQRSTFDAYSRPFQNFFKALSDGLPETGEYFEYDQDIGIGIATRDAAVSAVGTLGTLYSSVLGVDAFGNIAVEERKTGSTTLKVLKQFNPATGLTELIQAGTTSNPSAIQYLDMRWDRVGNLIYRNDLSAGRQLYEVFSYDAQQRLLTQKRGNHVSNATTSVLDLSYGSTGNIQSKNGQPYTYDRTCNAGPQAVSAAFGTSYCYDTRGNQISSTDGRQVVYLPFDLPSEIKNQHVGTSFTASTAFDYGPNHERLTRRNYPNVFGVTGTSSETTHYVGSAEIHRRPSGVEVKRYVGGVLIVQTASELTKRYQWFDHQGSVTAITDLAGAPIGSDGQMSYDAFGLRRDVQGSEFTPLRGFSFNTTATTRHGYTGHEMVDEAGLIHMNGRMYDPKLARFIQADPLVQDPNNSQSLNRYSYVMNNPLNATDPSGLFSVGSFSSLFSSINAQASFGSGFMQSCANSSACATAFAARGGNGSATQLPAGSVLGAFNNSAPDVSGLLEPSGWCDGSHDCNVSRWESAYFRSDITERQFVDRNMQAGYGGMIGSGGVVGGLYLASMGAAAGAIGGGFLDGMGYYALAVDGGAPLATLLGGAEGLVLAHSGVITPGSGVAGLAGRVEAVATNEMRSALGARIMFHGSSPTHTLALLNGAELNAVTAAANKLDGPLGFFLATHADDAFHFAGRRNSGTIIEYSFSPSAVKALNGLSTQPIANPARGFLRFKGNEAIVRPSQFEVFNVLRKNGDITMRPLNE